MSTLTLREAREKSGRTAEDLAAEAGIARPSLYRLEKGEGRPEHELAERLFWLYDGQVSLDDIFHPRFAQTARTYRRKKGLE